MVVESILKVLERKYVVCPRCGKEAIEERLLLEVYDNVRDEKWEEIGYWFQCHNCGHLAKY